jgi:hypothetical protein
MLERTTYTSVLHPAEPDTLVYRYDKRKIIRMDAD